MFDTIISRGAEKGEFLVQVDRQLAKMAVKHLSLYRGIHHADQFINYVLIARNESSNSHSVLKN
jgi:hypothetical protein